MPVTNAGPSGAEAASRPINKIDSTVPSLAWPQWIGWKVTGVRNRVEDLFWERRLKIQTCGKVMVHRADSHRYATVAYRLIFKILQRMNLNSHDVFVDIGCGKGRVVCCAATFPLRRIIGVDIDGELCGIARTNIRRLRHRKANIDILHMPAQECDYIEGTQFFLFHPFGEQTLRQVASVLARSVTERHRSVQIAYVNPVHDHVFEQHRRYEQFDRWTWGPWSGLKFDVSFWRLH